ncbi:MAG: alpha-glucan family phosphorylase [Sedimentisphaerales bacterium]|nr:alpha-glucan family phosphorylase [Sedimentisphaerales bacterium]
MKTIRTFVVVPSLPERLQPLKDIAYNMCWGWDHEAVDLFRRLDSDLWNKCQHNPVKLLGQLSQERLNAATEDAGLLAHLDRVCKKMQAYMDRPRWYDSQYRSTDSGEDNNQGSAPNNIIAYFSAEFGLHDCLPLYSGGLGVLAGDHLKSASDLGLPLVGIGLLYRQGYFQQYLNADGWQQESYPENDFYNMPVTLMIREDGRPIRFHINISGRDVVVQIWKIQVGRVNLYLLDTNLRCNRIEDRHITSQLYGGDNNMRIRQEILLGIGGFTALKTLFIEPAVCHMNEGHAAFMALERIRRVMEEHNLSFAQAREVTRSGNVFTTHTPVPAGHDVFPPTMMEKYFSQYCKQLGLDWQEFLGLGRTDPKDTNEPFSMTNLALRLSTYRNGVSQLHGEISRNMCQRVWKGVPKEEVPIGSITNGIHVNSWISHEMKELFDRYLGPGWIERAGDQTVFDKVDRIPDEELWRTHERRRERLVAFARRRLKSQLKSRGASPADIELAEEVLDPEALTIGFARRFATYKRGTLLFRDLERFVKILSKKDRPVQIIFAGKAHPRDTEGKELIRKIVHATREDKFRRRIVFMENYDINVARYLVQGVDVWLNTPRRGMEASGTSGMKVLVNGGLNLSVLDGWWCEGCNPETGWAIGAGESYNDPEYEDEVESHSLYDLLEKVVIPKFYRRGSDKLPREWLTMMKNSMKQLTAQFSTARMVADYARNFYIPSTYRWQKFMSEDMRWGKELADWKDSIRDRWGEVEVGKVDFISNGEMQVGGRLQVRCQVKLGMIEPDDVTVELYQGRVDSNGNIQNGEAVAMECIGAANDGYHIFNGEIPCRHSGLCGFAIRVIPSHPDLANKYDTGLIRWDTEEEEVPETKKEEAKAAK